MEVSDRLTRNSADKVSAVPNYHSMVVRGNMEGSLNSVGLDIES
jgi:hypothetical protein